jgi:hypothetical protein
MKEVNCKIIKETEKAVLIKTRSKIIYWVPKSVATITEVEQPKFGYKKCRLSAPKQYFNRITK